MDYLDKFRERRKELGLRQCDISAALGLRQCDISAALGFKKSTYSMYETRKNKMDVETFAEICRLLGITPNEALGFEEEG